MINKNQKISIVKNKHYKHRKKKNNNNNNIEKKLYE